MNWNAFRFTKANSACFPFVVQFPVKGQRVDQLPYFCGTGAPSAYVTIKVNRFPSLSTQVDCSGRWQVSNPYRMTPGIYGLFATEHKCGRSRHTCTWIQIS